MYCLDDGIALVDGPAAVDEPATALFPETSTGQHAGNTDETAILTHSSDGSTANRGLDKRLVIGGMGLVTVLTAGFLAYRYVVATTARSVNLIAVLPFENRSSNSDTEYLSDRLTDSLIYRLSHLPYRRVRSGEAS
jgi:hypothetical protein